MKCYLCGNEITDENKHGEHIIPNCIAGKLQCEYILHKKCGERLGKELDSHLARKFATLINLLDIKRDREGNLTGKIPITIEGSSINCIVKKGKLYIVDKLIDTKKMIIYSHPNAAKNLQKKYGINFKYITSLDIKDIIIDDIVSITDKDKECLTKIAIEFALYHGIPIEVMDTAFDVATRKFKTPLIIPYYPINKFESYIEHMKWYFEKKRIRQQEDVVIVSEYPSHSLHIFNDENRLYCFISLFSFFEFYIVLSDNYTRKNISEWHIESVVKTTCYTSRYDLRSEDPKDIDICAKHWNEDSEKIWQAVREQKKLDPQGGILTKRFYTEYKKTDPSSYMLYIAQRASQALRYQSCSQKLELCEEYIPLEIKSCLKLIAGNKSQFFDIASDLSFLYYIHEDQECFSMDRYKTLISDNNKVILLPKIIQDKGGDGEKEGEIYRKKILNLVIGSSELIYNSNEL